MYRTYDTDGTYLSCAVGCLIPDELYVGSIEGLHHSCITHKYYFPDNILKIKGYKDIFDYLQFMHDEYLPGTHTWEEYWDSKSTELKHSL